MLKTDIVGHGVMSSGYPFLIMTRFAISLHDFLKHKPALSKSSVMSLGHGLLDALQSIHEAGLTHNDIKSQNIMLGNYGQKFYLKRNNHFKDIEINLIDFGFADEYMVDGVHIIEE